MTHDGPDDDTLFERLQEATGADPTLRQIRRRYDDLRADYERLIDRLEDLEAHLEASRRAQAAQPVNTGAATQAGSLTESLTSPLYRLRDEYASALAGIQDIIEGLSDLAHGAFKGQRDSTGRTAPPTRAEPPPPVNAGGLKRVEVEVRGRGHAAMLGFQERLKAMPGVRRASISAIDDERATLVVELQPENDNDI